MKSYVYDDLDWPGNSLKNDKLSDRQIEKWLQYQKINEIFAKEFIPNFVAVFTWIKMIPPWPSSGEVTQNCLHSM